MALILSFLIHLLGGWLFSLLTPDFRLRKDPIGSDGLDVDLVAPRLAPPIRRYGPIGGEGRGRGGARGNGEGKEGEDARGVKLGGGTIALCEISSPSTARAVAASGSTAAKQVEPSSASEPSPAQLATAAQLAKPPVAPSLPRPARDRVAAAAAAAARAKMEARDRASAAAAAARARMEARDRASAAAAAAARAKMEARDRVTAAAAAAARAKQEARDRVAAAAAAAARAKQEARDRAPAAAAAAATMQQSLERQARAAQVAATAAEPTPPRRESPKQVELVALKPQVASPPPTARVRASDASSQVTRQESSTEALLRLYREAELPQTPTPAAVLATVQAEIRERQGRNRAVRRELRQREVEAERRLAALDALARRGAEESAGAIGSGPGQFGGAGDATRSRGGRSASRYYGLHFYLSGRPVKSSRVVRPPEAVELPPIRCRVDRIDITPATVRMLVDKAGSVGLAYLLYRSSSRQFDRCAVRHARSIRFRPGHDGNGVPLSVWINVRVEPSLLTAGL